MRILRYILLLPIYILFVTSCTETEVVDIAPPYEIGQDPNVYVAGAYYTIESSEDKYMRACYWNGGKRIDLVAVEGFESCANDIAIDTNGDVYIVGYDSDVFGVSYPCCWKNGVKTLLPCIYGGGEANAVALYDGRAYIVGEDNNKACYWRYSETGVGEILLSTDSSEANSIAISNVGDIYVVGENYNNACYFLGNGTFKYISTVGHTRAKDVCLDGSDIYVLWNDYSNAKGRICKNDNPSFVSIYSYVSRGSISVKDGKYIVTDGEKYNYYIGSNGSLRSVELTDNDCWIDNSYIKGDDVYLCGGTYNSSLNDVERACYWKNNNQICLDYSFGFATSIAVK